MEKFFRHMIVMYTLMFVLSLTALVLKVVSIANEPVKDEISLVESKVTTVTTTTQAETTAVTTTTTVATTTTEVVTTTAIEAVEPVEAVVESPEPESVSEEDYENTFYGISDWEYEMLVYTVYHESGNQSFECKQAVASVVVNRVNHGAFPDSIYSVLTQDGQFIGDYSYCYTPDEECYQAVDSVLSCGSTLPEEVVYFFASYCDNGWLWGQPIYSTIGDVVFAYI